MAELIGMLPSVESDHYRTEIFRKVLANQKLTPEQLDLVLEACSDMESDHYKTVVLKDALARVDSNAGLTRVMNAVSSIDSDHYASEVLMAAAPKVKTGSDEIKNAYRQAARGISSDHYYGQTLKAIER